MEVRHHVEQSDCDFVDLVLAEHGPGFHPLQQRRRLDVLLHNVEGRLFAFALEIVEDCRYAGVLEHSEHLRLSLEELEVFPIGKVGEVQFLDHHSTILAQVVAERCAGGRPLADHRDDLVAAGNRPAGRVRGFRGSIHPIELREAFRSRPILAGILPPALQPAQILVAAQDPALFATAMQLV